MFEIYENNIKVSETENVLTMIKYLFNRGIINDVNDNRINLFEDIVFEDEHFKVTND
jgi:hypothetical protein